MLHKQCHLLLKKSSDFQVTQTVFANSTIQCSTTALETGFRSSRDNLSTSEIISSSGEIKTSSSLRKQNLKTGGILKYSSPARKKKLINSMKKKENTSRKSEKKPELILSLIHI